MRVSPSNFICPACHQLVEEAVVCAFSHANTSNVLDAHAGIGHTAVVASSAAPSAGVTLRWLVRCKAAGKTLHPAWLVVQAGCLSNGQVPGASKVPGSASGASPSKGMYEEGEEVAAKVVAALKGPASTRRG